MSKCSNTTRRGNWVGDAAVFLLWALASILGVLTIAGLLSIGPLVLPFAAIALAVAARRTAVPRARPHCVAGILVGPAIAIGWLGTWLTYATNDPDDHCYRTSGGTTCESSGEVSAAGTATGTTPDHPGPIPAGFQWVHAWPFIAGGGLLMLVGIAAFVVAERRLQRA